MTRPDAIPRAAAGLRAFLEAGSHGDMDWMARNADRRADPRTLWPDVRTIVMLGVNYGPDNDPLAILNERLRGAISVYALGEDYHDLIKPRLKALARMLVDKAGGDVKVFVDTAPVMEKPLAQAAGLGWQGKHTNLVSRTHGSWLFLGAIFTTLELPPDPPEVDHCGSCHACLDVCPTAAFPAPYQLDARRCISYLTIEHKGPIPHALRGRRSATASMAATIASRSAPGTNSRKPDARRSLRRARLCARRRSPNWRGLTITASAPCSPRARSSASGGRASCAMC